MVESKTEAIPQTLVSSHGSHYLEILCSDHRRKSSVRATEVQFQCTHKADRFRHTAGLGIQINCKYGSKYDRA